MHEHWGEREGTAGEDTADGATCKGCISNEMRGRVTPGKDRADGATCKGYTSNEMREGLPRAKTGLMGLEGEVGWLADTAATAFSAAAVVLATLCPDPPLQ